MRMSSSLRIVRLCLRNNLVTEIPAQVLRSSQIHLSANGIGNSISIPATSNRLGICPTARGDDTAVQASPSVAETTW